MNKTLKRILIGLAILVLALLAAYLYMVSNTKKASPEQTVNYKGGEISVFYNRPSKKGREIFGKLVPYGEVWRTGANEATTFTNKTTLTIGGKELPAGTYTLWTIPQKDSWTVIFDKKQYSWGDGMDGNASYKAGEEALQVTVPVQNTSGIVEQFEISFTDSPMLSMVLAWDNTRVVVPMMK